MTQAPAKVCPMEGCRRPTDPHIPGSACQFLPEDSVPKGKASLMRPVALPGFETASRTDLLSGRFGVPPFTVLDSKAGYWQELKQRWMSLGIESELGRSDDVLFGSQANLNAIMDQKRKDVPEGEGTKMKGVSIFDPVMCELAYRWYSPLNGVVLDPFAGGSVRGIAAAALRRQYIGIELRKEQVEANRQQWERIKELLPDDLPAPRWLHGDCRDILPQLVQRGIQADFIFSCPPYADLEVYSNDPRDLSTMSPNDFVKAHSDAITKAAKVLKPNRYAAWVIGEARHAKTGEQYGLMPFTTMAFWEADCRYYNDHVLLTAIGSLPVRTARQFPRGRKAGRAHQYMLVYVKGDGKLASEACGEAWDVDWAVQP